MIVQLITNHAISVPDILLQAELGSWLTKRFRIPISMACGYDSETPYTIDVALLTEEQDPSLADGHAFLRELDEYLASLIDAGQARIRILRTKLLYMSTTGTGR